MNNYKEYIILIHEQKLFLIDNLFEILSLVVSIFIAYHIFYLNKKISEKDKYNHELEITKKINHLESRSVILADVEKYNTKTDNSSNKNYCKQGASFFNIIQQYGVEFVLGGTEDDGANFGLVPFEWIEYIRNDDSEDNKHIIVCKFKGIKWYDNFKSPFKEIKKKYKNKDYKIGDPRFLEYRDFK